MGVGLEAWVFLAGFSVAFLKLCFLRLMALGLLNRGFPPLRGVLLSFASPKER
jgi:hypothetical protein